MLVNLGSNRPETRSNPLIFKRLSLGKQLAHIIAESYDPAPYSHICSAFMPHQSR